MKSFLHSSFENNSRLIEVVPSEFAEIMVMGFTVVVIGVIYFYTNQLYNKTKVETSVDISKQSFFYRLSYHKFYVDELYDNIIVKPIMALSSAIYEWIDTVIINGIINGLGRFTIYSSSVIKNVQTGNIGFYVMIMVSGIAAILFFVIVKSFAF